MKKALVAILVLILSLCLSCNSNSENKFKIGIVQIVEHPSLDTIRESAVKKLRELSYIDGVNCNIDYKNAGGDISNLNSIINSFKADNKDIVLAIATPTAQAASRLSDKTPIIFSAVSDPILAGLVNSLDDTSGNITGTSDEIAVNKILNLAMDFFPKAKKIGLIYNLSEANSVSNIEKAKKFASLNNLEIFEKTVSSSSEVKQVGEIVASKVDFIFVPNDNMIATAMPVLSQIQIDTSTPIFVGADSMVRDGGFASFGIDYKELGRESGNMIFRVLEGENVSNIPVKVFNEDLFIYINESIADSMGILIPDSIKNNSKYKAIK